MSLFDCGFNKRLNKKDEMPTIPACVEVLPFPPTLLLFFIIFYSVIKEEIELKAAFLANYGVARPSRTYRIMVVVVVMVALFQKIGNCSSFLFPLLTLIYLRLLFVIVICKEII